MTFAHNLQSLPSTENIAALELFNEAGDRQAAIENKPGQSGSLSVYAYLAEKYGVIDHQAAQEGLSLFAEHTEHARLHPGSHPNIDRLLEVVSGKGRLHVQLVFKAGTESV